MTVYSEWAFIGKYWVGDGQGSKTYRGCVRVAHVSTYYEWTFLRSIKSYEGNPELEVTCGSHESRWSLLGLLGPKKPNPNWEEGKFKSIWDAVQDAERVLAQVFGVPEKVCPRELWHPLLKGEDV